MKRIHICLVAHFAYGAMVGGKTGHIGGVERQTSLMARWLAANGYQVSMLTWDEGQPNAEEVDGVRVHTICRQDAGVWGLRFFHPRWTGLIRAMRAADAEVYYHNCAEYVTGQIALWCGRHNRGFVYSVANDPECDPSLPDVRGARVKMLYRYGLRHADRIISQTTKQQGMLRQGFGLDSTVIPMPCPSPTDVSLPPHVAREPDARRILWIARICEQKRPDLFLDLAEACPDLQFDFVGPVDNRLTYSVAQRDRARSIPNVTVHGAVERDRVAEFYRKALCLCSTSDFEGFPNTFLEAWSHGLPIVSTFDPDGLIARHGLGVVGTDCQMLAAGIRSLLNSSTQREETSQAARAYFRRTHAIETVMPQFEAVLREVVAGRSRQRLGTEGAECT